MFESKYYEYVEQGENYLKIADTFDEKYHEY